tara:strand:- start:1457 stop:1687 length:231 start_codon:yes stop_codon:yes gene_type:complete
MYKKGINVDLQAEENLSQNKRYDKSSNLNESRARKVDINELKARAQEIENRESKKNISIFIFFLVILGTIGIYLSI